MPVAVPADPDDHDLRHARRHAADAGHRHGSEIRQPLGYTIVGGLLVSQVLTLFTTPVIYLYMDKLAHALRPKRAATPQLDGPSRRRGRLK